MKFILISSELESGNGRKKIVAANNALKDQSVNARISKYLIWILDESQYGLNKMKENTLPWDNIVKVTQRSFFFSYSEVLRVPCLEIPYSCCNARHYNIHER
jgi:hypothetical protein